MVHFITLYKTKTSVNDEKLEDMIRSSRSQLLKINEVLHIRSGKRIDKDSEWPFFVAIDLESVGKLQMYREDPIFIKFNEEVIRPYTTDSLELCYEMDPSKDTRYS